AGPLAVLRAGDVDHPEVAARGAGRELPQRTGREQPAVAVTAAGVHHFDLDVALQAVVLQPVVAQDDVAARFGQRGRGGGAVTVGAQRHAGTARDQDRLVAALLRGRVGLDPGRARGGRTPLAPAGPAGVPARRTPGP